MKKSGFTLENGTLVLYTDGFETSLNGFESADCRCENANGLSEPYLVVRAKTTEGAEKEYCLWEDLPLVYLPKLDETEFDLPCGEHWTVRNISLSAFTDRIDTLTTETQHHVFARTLDTVEGEIFLLEDVEKDRTIVIINETPDFQTAQLKIEKGVVSLKSGNNAVAFGYCRYGEGEALCRAYYRHARKCDRLLSMSNTWGDGNGAERVCHDFVIKEIDAARKIGVDIVQIDDGWQVGRTDDPARRNAKGRREFLGDFWDLNEERFPDMRALTDYAAQYGIKIGLWFAPESMDHFSLMDRDLSVLRRAYDEWGFRFFKLDMYWIESEEDRDRVLEFLEKIYSFGDDVAVQLDVTRYARINYLCGRQFGSVFVENRYHMSGNSYPHRLLRNLWMLSRYLPSNKFQFEMINPDLNRDRYPDGDPFVPSLYSQDYLFACVMLSNPLFWHEMQFLSEERTAQLLPVMQLWKEHRDRFAKLDVMPVGEKPSGRSITGFLLSENEKSEYLLVFREVTDRVGASFAVKGELVGAEVLFSNASATASVTAEGVAVSLSEPRSWALVRLTTK